MRCLTLLVFIFPYALINDSEVSALQGIGRHMVPTLRSLQSKNSGGILGLENKPTYWPGLGSFSQRTWEPKFLLGITKITLWL